MEQTRPDTSGLISLPAGISAPAGRALASINVTYLEDLMRYTDAEIAMLHGMGPKVMGILKRALEEKELGFKEEK